MEFRRVLEQKRLNALDPQVGIGSLQPPLEGDLVDVKTQRGMGGVATVFQKLDPRLVPPEATGQIKVLKQLEDRRQLVVVILWWRVSLRCIVFVFVVKAKSREVDSAGNDKGIKGVLCSLEFRSDIEEGPILMLSVRLIAINPVEKERGVLLTDGGVQAPNGRMGDRPERRQDGGNQQEGQRWLADHGGNELRIVEMIWSSRFVLILRLIRS